MRETSKLKEKVDRLAELNRQMAEIRSEAEELKAWFEKEAVEDLLDCQAAQEVTGSSIHHLDPPAGGCAQARFLGIADYDGGPASL